MKPHHKTRILLVLLAIAVGLAIWWFPSRRMKREPHLAQPGRLSETVRSFLGARMRRHGQDLSELAVDVVVLDFERVAAVASEIQQDASLARPVGEDATLLNAQLPERFFVLQDQLKQSAAALAEAAAAKDSERMADAWGRMSGACVRCHSTYLKGAP